MGEIEAEYFFRGNNPKNRMMYVKRQFQKCKKPHRETKILLDILHELLKLKLLMAAHICTTIRKRTAKWLSCG